MIVKREDGYYVVSEKTEKNLGGPYKTGKKLKRGFGKWNTLSIKRKLISLEN